MKKFYFVAALVLGLAVAACSPKANEAAEGEEGIVPQEMTAKDFLPTKAEVDSVSYLVGIQFGSFIKGYDFGDLNYSEIMKAIKDFVNSKGDMNDPEFNEQFKVNPERMNDLFNSYLEKRHNLKVCENREKEAKYLAENGKKNDVVTAESGLQYKIINPGNEVKPGPKDTVWVNYCGKLIDGTVFDETPEDAEPVRMVLNRVIKGFQEGLQLIGEGGEIELTIPSDLGYGEQGNRSIDPCSTLIFNVKMDKVGKVAE